MVISDFFHLRLGASVGDQQHSYSLKVFIVFVALGLPFPQVHLSVWRGEGVLSSKHTLWNFHRSCYALVTFINPQRACTEGYSTHYVAVCL